MALSTQVFLLILFLHLLFASAASQGIGQNLRSVDAPAHEGKETKPSSASLHSDGNTQNKSGRETSPFVIKGSSGMKAVQRNSFRSEIQPIREVNGKNANKFDKETQNNDLQALLQDKNVMGIVLFLSASLSKQFERTTLKNIEKDQQKGRTIWILTFQIEYGSANTLLYRIEVQSTDEDGFKILNSSYINLEQPKLKTEDNFDSVLFLKEIKRFLAETQTISEQFYLQEVKTSYPFYQLLYHHQSHSAIIKVEVMYDILQAKTFLVHKEQLTEKEHLDYFKAEQRPIVFEQTKNQKPKFQVKENKQAESFPKLQSIKKKFQKEEETVQNSNGPQAAKNREFTRAVKTNMSKYPTERIPGIKRMIERYVEVEEKSEKYPEGKLQPIRSNKRTTRKFQREYEYPS